MTGSTIVVGVDSSAGAQRAVDWALEEAVAHGDSVRLVHVLQYPAVGVGSVAGTAVPVFGHDDLKQLACKMLEVAAARARKCHPGVMVETSVVKGHPGGALIEAAKGARLLAVGTRGRGGFKGMVLGSVSSTCAHHGRCPVVIVPPAPRDGEDGEEQP